MRAWILALLLPFPALAWAPATTCPGPTYGHWTGLPTPYKLRPKLPGARRFYSGLDDVDVQLAVARGFAVWSSPGTCQSGFTATSAGTSTESWDVVGADNVIEFVESGWNPAWGAVDAVIALTATTWSNTTCVISEAGQVYNAQGFDFSVTDPPATNHIDLPSIAAHESGHWLGLGHTPDTVATMYGSNDGGTSQRDLAPDDDTGVCTLYPGAATCPATATLACDVDVSGSTGGGSSHAAVWSCSPRATAGREKVYTFTAPHAGTFVIEARSATADVDLFVTEALSGTCRPSLCLDGSFAGGTSSELVSFDAAAGVTYAVVVDAVGGDASFVLHATCDPEADCDNGVDDDGDLLVDCDDPDCDGLASDIDEDGVCDQHDQCIGDDATGDTDGDRVCDDEDACEGDDGAGDTDDDGVCDDGDACDGDDASGDADGDGTCDDVDPCTDVDGDGACPPADCDDDDPDVFPGQVDLCDGVDDDCTGADDCPIDEGGLRGCGCSHGGAPGAWPLLSLLLWRRRR